MRRAGRLLVTLLLLGAAGLTRPIAAAGQAACPVDDAVPPPGGFPVDIISPGSKYDDSFRELFIAGVTARFVPDPLPEGIATGGMYVIDSGFVSEVPAGGTAPVTIPVVCVGTRVPDVRGSTMSVADTSLAELGLTARTEAPASGLVGSQTPAAGQLVPFGTTVVLQPPAPVTTAAAPPVEEEDGRDWVAPAAVAGISAVVVLGVLLVLRAARRRELKEAQQRIGARPVAGPMTTEVAVARPEAAGSAVELVLHRDPGTQRVEEPGRR